MKLKKQDLIPAEIKCRRERFRKRYAYISLTLAISVTFMFLIYNAFNRISMATSENKVISEPKIRVIIDPGHGGEDGGAQGEDGTLEKDLNLSISMILKDMLVQGGFEVELIREEDTAVGDNSLDSVKERKRSDLEKRVEIYNSDENNIVVSIHQNKFEESKYSGTQIFYSENPKSEELAEYIRKAVVGLVQPENQRQSKQADGSIYVLRNAEVPAIIVECGFLSNPQELAQLKDFEYQKKLAFAVYMGIAEYSFNMNNS